MTIRTDTTAWTATVTADTDELTVHGIVSPGPGKRATLTRGNQGIVPPPLRTDLRLNVTLPADPDQPDAEQRVTYTGRVDDAIDRVHIALPDGSSITVSVVRTPPR